MLAIRMQRTGRKGHAMFRVIVQDARRTPTSGKIVAQLGSYDPHTKAISLDKEKAGFYLEHGAQPSEGVARLLKNEGVKLPGWVKLADKREGSVRNPEKRRSTRPDGPAEPETPAEEAPSKETEATENSEAPAETNEAASESTAPEEATQTTEPETAADDKASEEAEKPAAETAETAETTDKPAEEAPAEEAESEESK